MNKQMMGGWVGGWRNDDLVSGDLVGDRWMTVGNVIHGWVMVE